MLTHRSGDGKGSISSIQCPASAVGARHRAWDPSYWQWESLMSSPTVVFVASNFLAFLEIL